MPPVSMPAFVAQCGKPASRISVSTPAHTAAAADLF